jgi:hypothetical protein
MRMIIIAPIAETGSRERRIFGGIDGDINSGAAFYVGRVLPTDTGCGNPAPPGMFL